MREKELVARYERSKVPTSIEQFDTEEEKALQLLANIRAKKQAAIEAKKLPGVLKPHAHLVAFFLEEDALSVPAREELPLWGVSDDKM